MPTLAALPIPRPARPVGSASSVPRRASTSRRHALAAGLVVLASAGMLGIFQRVVREAARQGDLRREATARHSAATWGCIIRRSARERDLCLAQLNAAPPAVTLLPAAAEGARREEHQARYGAR